VRTIGQFPSQIYRNNCLSAADAPVASQLQHVVWPQVRFWALDTLRCVRKCEGHEDAVRVLAVADGRVFSGSYDGSIGVWV